MGGWHSETCKITLRKPLKDKCLNNSQNKDLQLKNMIKLKYDFLSNDYFIHTPSIGKGSYGEVFKVTHRLSGIVRAAKKIDRSILYDNGLMKEYEILRQLEHPSIIKIFEIYMEERYQVIVMDYCGGGELFETLKKQQRLTQSEAAYYIKQIFYGVSYCHSRGIIHGDLKPENILLENNQQGKPQIKIGDFGASRFTNQKNQTSFGTRLYRAPEVFHQKATEKCDVWSCGVMLYFMIVGRLPFRFDQNTPVVECRTIIEKGDFDKSIGAFKYASSAFKDLISKMLAVNQQKRLSACEVLKHQWLKQADQKFKISDEEIKQAIYNMRQFSQSSDFEILILFYIFNYMTNYEERKRFRTLFKDLDADVKGTLGEQQLLKMKVGNIKLNKEEVRKVFNKICKQPKDRMTYIEFITVTSKKSKILARQNLQKLVLILDPSRKGKIQVSQLIENLGGNRRFFKCILKEITGSDVDFFTNQGFIEYLLKK